MFARLWRMNTFPASGTWYLFDYGKVISTEPFAEDWDALGEAAGLDLRSPSSSYWAARAPDACLGVERSARFRAVPRTVGP